MTASDNQLPDSLVQHPEISQSSPFDFHGAVRWLGGNPTSMFSRLLIVVDQVDDMLPAGPIVVHSEHAGTGVRLSSFFAYNTYCAYSTYSEYLIHTGDKL